MSAADEFAQIVHSALGVPSVNDPADAAPVHRLPAPNKSQGRGTGTPQIDPMTAAVAAFADVTAAVIHGPTGMWTDLETLERS